MLLVIKYSTVCKFRFVMTRQNISCITKTTVHIFFASFIASTTSRAIFLTSFCQAGRESSATACHIVNINTIILYVCYLFKYACILQDRKKMPHMLDKARFKQYKYPTSTNTRLANDWWCSWMWGLAAP